MHFLSIYIVNILLYFKRFAPIDVVLHFISKTRIFTAVFRQIVFIRKPRKQLYTYTFLFVRRPSIYSVLLLIYKYNNIFIITANVHLYLSSTYIYIKSRLYRQTSRIYFILIFTVLYFLLFYLLGKQLPIS